MDFSPTPHGVGGLKSRYVYVTATNTGPTPHGVGGLKSEECKNINKLDSGSHSPRSGWIEITRTKSQKAVNSCPTPHGVGGLKFLLWGSICLTS